MGLKERALRAVLVKHKILLENIEQGTGTSQDKTTEASQDKGNWLKSTNCKFGHGYKLMTPHMKRITSELFNFLTKGEHLYKRGKKLRDLEILVANLLARGSLRTFQGKVYRTCEPVRISRSRKSYTKSRYTRASSYIIDLLDMLKGASLLKQAKGYRTKEESMLTRIWPTEKLLTMYQPIDLTIDLDFEHVELVILRDKDKKEMKYNDTAKTNRIRRILRNANILNRQAVIQVKTPNGYQRINTDLHAIFNNGSFNQGGRLYTGFNGYQSLSEDESANIHINNEPTVELDFSGLHPRLLYAIEGLQYDCDRDPYKEVSDDEALRPLLKELLFMLLYSKNETKAVAAGNYEFCFISYREYFKRLKTAGLKVKDLIQMCKVAHSPIARHFSAQACFKLMNIDSKIALDVIEHFTVKDIPVLAIHDSFIVSAQYENELNEVMKNAYRKHSKGFECPVARKQSANIILKYANSY